MVETEAPMTPDIVHVLRGGGCEICGGTGRPDIEHVVPEQPAQAKPIVLSEEPPPPTLEDQIRAAIYQACNYYWPTKIVVGHRGVYLVDQWTFERYQRWLEAGDKDV